MKSSVDVRIAQLIFSVISVIPSCFVAYGLSIYMKSNPLWLFVFLDWMAIDTVLIVTYYVARLGCDICVDTIRTTLGGRTYPITVEGV
jgi:hypothetical protein